MEIKLPYEVVKEQGNAKFDGKRKVLRVNLPVKQGKEEMETEKVEKELESGEIEGEIEEKVTKIEENEGKIEEFETKIEENEGKIEEIETKIEEKEEQIEGKETEIEKNEGFLHIYKPENDEKPGIEETKEMILSEIRVHPPISEPISSIPPPKIEEISIKSPEFSSFPSESPENIEIIEENRPNFTFSQDSSPISHILFPVPGLKVSSLESNLFLNGFKAKWTVENAKKSIKTEFCFEFEGKIDVFESKISAIIDYVVVKIKKIENIEWPKAGDFSAVFIPLEPEFVPKPDENPSISEEIPEKEPKKESIWSYISFETPLLYELV